ncbi:SigE family RNA polymerase sigma factor [Virgisporangium aurantiacum]|uniref:RNA polymerase sigma24 factor n=1 Tax=Virgisporangium aurantiacum TaxID=175570 RepID=A0A8J4E188_9ACTN|nr:SigE family RNA polymerase sigma factor [Virgisporangium aurantiacum]GIJ57508.1 RNA polymerase sigma24 factor [Virgisporangium aurantiacum]
MDFAEYVSARTRAVHRSAYLLCGDRHRADDLVQATFVSLFLHWRRARRADNLDAYVHRILVRRYLDEKRLGWNRVRLMWTTPEPRPADPGPSDDRDLIMDALRRLPKGQRTVLVLRYFADLSVEDTADAMGCSPGTVKSQTARALAAIRRHFPEETRQR